MQQLLIENGVFAGAVPAVVGVVAAVIALVVLRKAGDVAWLVALPALAVAGARAAGAWELGGPALWPAAAWGTLAAGAVAAMVTDDRRATWGFAVAAALVAGGLMFSTLADGDPAWFNALPPLVGLGTLAAVLVHARLGDLGGRGVGVVAALAGVPVLMIAGQVQSLALTAAAAGTVLAVVSATPARSARLGAGVLAAGAALGPLALAGWLNTVFFPTWWSHTSLALLAAVPLGALAAFAAPPRFAAAAGIAGAAVVAVAAVLVAVLNADFDVYYV